MPMTNRRNLSITIIEHKEWGFRILMIITDSALIQKKFGATIRIYPDKINIKNILDIDIIDEVIYCKSNIDDEKLRNLIEICEEIGVTFRLTVRDSPYVKFQMHILLILTHVLLLLLKIRPEMLGTCLEII